MCLSFYFQTSFQLNTYRLWIQVMKVSIFGILCLLMMVLYSHSFPQMSEECSHCGAGHEACWEICLSSYSQDDEYYNKYDDFAFSANDNMPCGKIRTCLKPKFSNRPMCKTAPKELPDRCVDKTDEPTGDWPKYPKAQVPKGPKAKVHKDPSARNRSQKENAPKKQKRHKNPKRRDEHFTKMEIMPG